MSITIHEGVLIECDVPTMQIIELLDEQEGFIVRRLDERHVFVEEEKVELIEEEVRKLIFRTIYDASDEKKRTRR